ncbi:MAG: DUF2764 family protein [Lentisphaeria bacterium]|nr:DUF2764 family protein [Lentisphaeria bacterium]
MAVQYYYQVSALPMLSLGDKPRIGLDDFEGLCRSQLPPHLAAVLLELSLDPVRLPCCEVEKRWQDWEVWLRNTLVRLRAARVGFDAAAQMRPEGDSFPTDRRRVEEIFGDPNPRTRALELDRLRWQRLDDLGVQHPFDEAALILYKLKLLLAWRWATASVEQGRERHDRLTVEAAAPAGTRRVPTGSTP